ncbi:hypothetical protein [Flavobacterium facile]|uniref:hypothetical protein n=1 Tax=Flavobacterium facile TaxID=2893174 RepID=UPI002E7A0CCB|nr:hypothetical protein [Flavobacterium sp. T-12]
MRKVLFLVLFALKLNAQDTIVFPKIDLFKRNIVEVSYGIPLGDLANKYESTINSAIYFRTKIAKKQFVDFGLEMSGVVQGNAIKYKFNGENVILDGSKSAFLLGLRYTRFLYQSKNEVFHIESNSGLGWKYLHYSKPEDEKYKEIDFQPILNTIAFTQGVKIMYNGFGVFCNYQYAPYDLFNSKIENHFGGESINFGISGSWNF